MQLPAMQRSDTDKTASKVTTFSQRSTMNDGKDKTTKRTTVLKSHQKLHHSQKSVIFAPSTKEEAENEQFARKVGINFSLQRGDYLTVVGGFPSSDEDSISLTPAYLMSPVYGKNKDIFHTYGNVKNILEDINATPVKSNPSQNYVNRSGLITPRTRSAMIDHDQIIETLRERAAILSTDWCRKDYLAPTIARRLRDFEFAQKKRKKTFGQSRQLGVLSLYDFLSEIRVDIEWAELAAFNRSNCLPYVTWNDYVSEKKREMNRPAFVYFISFVCTAAFVTSLALNGWKIENFSVNPSLGPSASTLILMGAKESNLIVNHNEFWRLFTPMILHGGVVHFLFNFFAFAYIGRAIEYNHGFYYTLFLFVYASVGGTIFSALLLPGYISVGASGGIFGLIGACVSDIIQNRKLLFSDFVQGRNNVYVVVILVVDILLNLLLGLTPFTDNFMHIGGFGLGLIWSSTTLPPVRFFGMDEQSKEQKSSVLQRMKVYVGPIVSMILILVVTIYLYKGDGKSSPCDICSVMSCVSFPPGVPKDKKWWHCDACGQVSAYGTIDTVSEQYISLQLQCPSGKMVDISVEDYHMDRSIVETKLVDMCRQSCE